MRSIVADGNFKADHLQQRNKADDVWLTDGEAFMTNNARYEKHLDAAIDLKEVSNLAQFGIPFGPAAKMISNAMCVMPRHWYIRTGAQSVM